MRKSALIWFLLIVACGFVCQGGCFSSKKSTPAVAVKVAPVVNRLLVLVNNETIPPLYLEAGLNQLRDDCGWALTRKNVTRDQCLAAINGDDYEALIYIGHCQSGVQLGAIWRALFWEEKGVTSGRRTIRPDDVIVKTGRNLRFVLYLGCGTAHSAAVNVWDAPYLDNGFYSDTIPIPPALSIRVPPIPPTKTIINRNWWDPIWQDPGLGLAAKGIVTPFASAGVSGEYDPDDIDRIVITIPGYAGTHSGLNKSKAGSALPVTHPPNFAAILRIERPYRTAPWRDNLYAAVHSDDERRAKGKIRPHLQVARRLPHEFARSLVERSDKRILGAIGVEHQQVPRQRR